ncbi:hypothetical protein [Clostridium manihotivorum]|uniref:Uncharacterized protein n=1 Tax=Clostridium manihotivorum TaxID=2320868 RepID=A0A410DN18_9CLOT|nr:hypothetical protein [Clostridium manihotivorum]QAA30482.1 hypothetical protein C1I91_01700 [Clostridium manihotivorum]
MKYSIMGFNQEKLMEFGLDIKDAAILRYFVDFMESFKMRNQVIDKEIYYWVKYEGIIKQYPILNLSNADSVYRRFKKLVKLNILKHKTVVANGKYSYYTLGDNYIELIFEYNMHNFSRKKDKFNDVFSQCEEQELNPLDEVNDYEELIQQEDDYGYYDEYDDQRLKEKAAFYNAHVVEEDEIVDYPEGSSLSDEDLTEYEQVVEDINELHKVEEFGKETCSSSTEHGNKKEYLMTQNIEPLAETAKRYKELYGFDFFNVKENKRVLDMEIDAKKNQESEDCEDCYDEHLLRQQEILNYFKPIGDLKALEERDKDFDLSIFKRNNTKKKHKDFESIGSILDRCMEDINRLRHNTDETQLDDGRISLRHQDEYPIDTGWRVGTNNSSINNSFIKNN